MSILFFVDATSSSTLNLDRSVFYFLRRQEPDFDRSIFDATYGKEDPVNGRQTIPQIPFSRLLSAPDTESNDQCETDTKRGVSISIK